MPFGWRVRREKMRMNDIVFNGIGAPVCNTDFHLHSYDGQMMVMVMTMMPEVEYFGGNHPELIIFKFGSKQKRFIQFF
jgi:hypothetical protein